MRVAFQGTVVTFPGGARQVTIDTDDPVTVGQMLAEAGVEPSADSDISVGHDLTTDLDTVVESGGVVSVTKRVDAG